MKQRTIRKPQATTKLDTLPRRQGRKELAKHLQGKQTTPQGAMRAKCYDCMGYYADGAVDCEMPSCPLYPWMPYRQKANPCYVD